MAEKDDTKKVFLTGIVNKVADKFDLKLSGKTVEHHITVNIENLVLPSPPPTPDDLQKLAEEVARETVKQLAREMSRLFAQPPDEQARIITNVASSNATAVFQYQGGGALRLSGKPTYEKTPGGASPSNKSTNKGHD
jgi:hypothetical protein